MMKCWTTREMLFRVIWSRRQTHHFSCCHLPSPMSHHPTNNNPCPAKEEWPALYGVCVLCTRLIQNAFTGLVLAVG